MSKKIYMTLFHKCLRDYIHLLVETERINILLISIHNVFNVICVVVFVEEFLKQVN